MRAASILPLALVLALLLAGCASPGSQIRRATGTDGGSAQGGLEGGIPHQECPDHWHATFRVFTPGEGGNPRMLGLDKPTDAYGRPYYDLGNGKMGLAAHMHQSGPEQGSSDLGPAQMHYEASGKCVDVQDSMAIVDVGLTATSLRITGEHRQSSHDGLWVDGEGGELRTWIQGSDETWRERDPADVLGLQLQDGDALLIAFGSYTDEQVAAMQATVPAPMSRSAPEPAGLDGVSVRQSLGEDWEAESGQWTFGPGGARDCNDGHASDCSLLLAPACCGEHVAVTHAFDPPIQAVWVDFAFLASSLTGHSDAEVVLDYGPDVPPLVFSVTRGIGDNNGMSLDNGQPDHNPCGEWHLAGAWVDVSVYVDGYGLAAASAYDNLGDILGDCEYRHPGGALHAIRFQAVVWDAAPLTFRFDDVWAS